MLKLNKIKPLDTTKKYELVWEFINEDGSKPVKDDNYIREDNVYISETVTIKTSDDPGYPDNQGLSVVLTPHVDISLCGAVPSFCDVEFTITEKRLRLLVAALDVIKNGNTD